MSGGRWVNDTEVVLASLRRSGHHAVLSWIADQLPGPAVHLNNLVPGEHPLRTCRRRLLRDSRVAEARRLEIEERHGPAPKNLLLLNYEDRDLRAVFSEEERERREQALGPSRRRLHVLVLRDHYNLFASRLRRVRLGSLEPREDLRRAHRARRLYVAYAREFLGETRRLGEGGIAVSFNRWFADVKYRRALARRLGGVPSDATRNELARAGAGSSFDGDRYRGRAAEMDVLGRWREMERDLLYRGVVGEPVLRRLTRRAFGPVAEPLEPGFRGFFGAAARPLYLALDRFLSWMARHGPRS